METLLAERPMMLSIMVGGVGALLLYSWLQSGDKRLAVAGVLFAILIPVIWVVAGAWETDREQIRSLIDQTAAAIADNDIDRAVQVIADKQTREQARSELPRYEFQRVVASGPSISIDANSVPPVAQVDLIAKVIASDRAGRFNDMRIVRRVLLTFEKSGDRWEVVGYNHMQPGGQPDAFSPPNVVGERTPVRTN